MDDFNDGWMTKHHDPMCFHRVTFQQPLQGAKFQQHRRHQGGTESCKAAVDEATIHATNVLKSSKNGSRKVHTKRTWKKNNEMGIRNILNIKLQLE